MVHRISVLCRFVNVVALGLLMLIVGQAQAGVVIGGTRVVYPSNKKEVTVSISNLKGSDVYLIQSWIDAGNANKKSPFIVTPPLFRINVGEENLLRIVYTGGDLPQDRETVFWLNVKAIPAMTEESAENVLQVVVKSRLKLFYRPAGLSGSPMEAYRQLGVSKVGKKLRISNPSPYFISLFSLKINDIEIREADMVPPKGYVDYALPAQGPSTVSWQAINDYGGISETENRQL